MDECQAAEKQGKLQSGGYGCVTHICWRWLPEALQSFTQKQGWDCSRRELAAVLLQHHSFATIVCFFVYIFKIYFILNYGVHKSAGVHGSQKRLLVTLELELQAAVSPLMWVLCFKEGTS